MTIASQLTSINDSKQAIKTAIEAKGVTVGTAAFDQYATKISEIVTAPAAPELWTRNPSWLPLPTVTDTENKFAGLHLVEADSNFLALTVNTSSGQYQIDWGDGDIQNVNSATTAYHQYDFADADIPDSTRAPVTFTASTDLVTRTAHGYTNGMILRFSEITSTTGISTNTNYYVVNATADTFQLSLTAGGSAIDLVTDGSGYILPYKQVIVVITPVTSGANLTTVNLNVKHNQSNLQAYTSGWLDCVLSAPSLTTLTVGAVTPIVRQGNLEQFSLLKSNLTNFNSLFNNCGELRSVPSLVPAATGNVTCANLFQNCYKLTHFPQSVASFSTRITTLDTACRDCSSLAVVPDLDLSAITNLSSVFQDCSALTTIGTITTGTALTTCQNLFWQCRSLTEAPFFNTQNVTITSGMFNGCTSLAKVPLYNTAAVTNMAQWFQNCSKLTTVPLYNTAAVTSMVGMFLGCFALESVPFFNTSSVTAMNTMFQNCRSLQTIPPFDVSAVTTAATMFAGCIALESIPSLNFDESLTSTNNFASGCSTLRSVGAMSFNGVTSSAGLTSSFNACPNLSKLGVTGAKFTHSIGFCKLTASELNNYYTNLPTVTGQTLTVSGNWGVATDDPSIATAKGWTVTG